jgi:hypothetical protein
MNPIAGRIAKYPNKGKYLRPMFLASNMKIVLEAMHPKINNKKRFCMSFII